MGEERKAHDRHLAWCANLLNEACVQWFGPAQESWCVTLRLESANLRAAAEHCLRQRDKVDVALRLVGDPWFVWVALFLDEGRYWLEKALALASDETPARAKALATAGYVTSLQGDFAAAESFLTASRYTAGMLEDTANQGYATHVLGVNALFADPAKAVSLLREGLLLDGQVPELSDDYVVALRVQLGLALLFEAELDAAEEQFVSCRDLCTASGERWLLSYALYGLAFVSYARGDLESGFSLARQALRIKRFFGDTLGLAVTLDLLAWMTAARDGAEQAAVLLGAASGSGPASGSASSDPNTGWPNARRRSSKCRRVWVSGSTAPPTTPASRSTRPPRSPSRSKSARAPSRRRGPRMSPSHPRAGDC